MATLDVRRHTMRRKPGQHLSQGGISLAHHISRDSGTFDLVATSDVPRAIETAVAMGVAVDRIIPELGILPDLILAAIDWPQPFRRLSKVADENESCKLFATQQAQVWMSVLDALSEHQTGLIVTHGGIIELGAIGVMPDADHADWGGAIGYCEGFRITQSSQGLTCKVLRVAPQFQMLLS